MGSSSDLCRRKGIGRGVWWVSPCSQVPFPAVIQIPALLRLRLFPGGQYWFVESVDMPTICPVPEGLAWHKAEHIQ